MSLMKQIEMAHPLVTDHAKKMAIKMDVPTNAFEIILVPRLKQGDMVIQQGLTVKIALKWPDVLPNLNGILRQALLAIKRRDMYTPLELGTRAIVHNVKDEKKNRTRRWVGKKTRGEASTVVLDLINADRIKVVETTVTKLVDTITGEEVTRSETYEYPMTGRTVSQEWVMLSQVVFEKHPEELDEYDESGTNGDSGSSDLDNSTNRSVALVLRTEAPLSADERFAGGRAVCESNETPSGV